MQISSVDDWLFINSITFLGICFCTGWKRTKCDFSIFTESLFADSQRCTFPGLLLISLSSMLRSLSLKKINLHPLLKQTSLSATLFTITSLRYNATSYKYSALKIAWWVFFSTDLNHLRRVKFMRVINEVMDNPANYILI